MEFSSTFFTFFLLFQETIKQVFDNLIQLDHANIVKFHRYWVDKVPTDQRRVSL